MEERRINPIDLNIIPIDRNSSVFPIQNGAASIEESYFYPINLTLTYPFEPTTSEPYTNGKVVGLGMGDRLSILYNGEEKVESNRPSSGIGLVTDYTNNISIMKYSDYIANPEGKGFISCAFGSTSTPNLLIENRLPVCKAINIDQGSNCSDKKPILLNPSLWFAQTLRGNYLIELYWDSSSAPETCLEIANYFLSSFTDLINCALLSKNTLYSIYDGVSGKKIDTTGDLVEDFAWICFGTLEEPYININPIYNINQKDLMVEFSKEPIASPNCFYINSENYIVNNYGEYIVEGDGPFGGVNIGFNKKDKFIFIDYSFSQLEDKLLFSLPLFNGVPNHITTDSINNYARDIDSDFNYEYAGELTPPIDGKIHSYQYMVFNDNREIDIIEVESKFLPGEVIGEQVQQYLIENGYQIGLLLNNFIDLSILTREGLGISPSPNPSTIGFYINFSNVPSIKKICWKDPLKKK